MSRHLPKIKWSIYLIIFIGIILRGQTAWINHDEAQFMASAWMIKTQGLYPILDFVYYHQPTYSLLQAFLIGLVDSHYLQIVRLFTSLFVVLSLWLILHFVGKDIKKAGGNLWERFLLPVTFALLLGGAFSTLTGITSWNHAFPTFLLLLAFYVVGRSHEHYRPYIIAVAGISFALAVGFRASLAPMLVPIFVALFFYKLGLKKRLVHALAFFIGCLLGSIPVFIYMAIDFDAYFFNVYEFHTEFDQAYLEFRGSGRTLSSRLGFATKQFFGTPNAYFSYGSLALIIVFILGWIKGRARIGFRLWFWTTAFVMSIIGAVMKNVTFEQYYYLPILLAGIWVAEMYVRSNWSLRHWGLRVTFVVAIIFQFDINSLYRRLGREMKDGVFVTGAHNEGVAIRQLAGEGPVLTLAPEFPIEGGCTIYPEFVTAPFAYRTRDFVPEEYRDKYNVIGLADLENYLANKSPAAVYTGWENELDEGLEEWASENGYEMVITPMEKRLWVRPER